MPLSSARLTLGARFALGAGLLAMLSSSVVGCSLLSPSSPPATDSTTGAEIAQNDADVFALSVGQCLNDRDTSGQVSDVPSVDCASEHDSEVYYTFDLDDGDFPGDASVEAAAETGCESQFTAYVGADYEASSLAYTYYSPTQDSWESAEDREVVCIVYNGDLTKLTGSVKGSGL